MTKDELLEKLARMASLYKVSKAFGKEKEIVDLQIRELKIEVQPEYIDFLGNIGQSNVKQAGVTIFPKRTLKAWPKDGDDAGLEALATANLDELAEVKRNVDFKNLRAYLRECEENGTEIPEPLASAFTMQREITIEMRMSS